MPLTLTPRAYQLAIYNSILDGGNTLVVLPTGLGKTLVAAMVINKKMSEGRCLFLAPTKPLAKQHFTSLKEVLGVDDDIAAIVTGELKPEKRVGEYDKKIVISTPQTTENDLKNGRLLPEFSVCIFDEAHKSVGNYAYTYVAQRLNEGGCLIVGLTASPGGKKERIAEVMDALFIKNIEIRTSLDEDVKPYVQQSNVKWIPIMLSPTLKLIKITLEELISKYAHNLGSLGFPPPLKNKGQFMALRQRILNFPHGVKYQAIVHYSVLLHLLHMLELIETQGVFALRSYIEKMHEKESKSAKLLLKETNFTKVTQLCNTEEEHPKLKVLIDLVKSLKDKKIIVFAQYRDQIGLIERELQKHGVTAKQFVGKTHGFTRKMQEEAIADFRIDKFRVLVASSIGEEGLDIPAVDVVIFYEPIPSEIRTIQRRGRAARFKEGEIYILMTKDTRDEYYYWSSSRKEKKMKEIIGSMQRKMKKGLEARGLKVEATVDVEKNKLEGQTRMKDFFG